MDTHAHKTRARALLQAMKAAGKKPDEIVAATQTRFTKRTLYRWLSGDHGPQRQSDVDTLEALAAEWGVTVDTQAAAG